LARRLAPRLVGPVGADCRAGQMRPTDPDHGPCLNQAKCIVKHSAGINSRRTATALTAAADSSTWPTSTPLPPEKLAERYAPAPGADGGDGIWYFICPARSRHRATAAGAPGQGCWASEAGVVRPVRGPVGRGVGQLRALSYGARTAALWTTVTMHGWCMVELVIDEQDGGGGGGEFVRLPHNAVSTTAASASMAMPAARISSCKRKAATDNHPEAPSSVRRQLMQLSF
ncbi:hypothetical protein BAE44_0019175, partial [Dichanthelium oligosanthes]